MAITAGSWTILRVLRIIIGVSILFSIPGSEQPYLLGIIGSIVTMQGILNIGCGVNGCSPKSINKNIDSQQEVNFEEVK